VRRKSKGSRDFGGETPPYSVSAPPAFDTQQIAAIVEIAVVEFARGGLWLFSENRKMVVFSESRKWLR